MSTGLREESGITFTSEELTALKTLASKPKKRWWQDYPFIVSCLAFLLSLTTAIISAYASHLHDIHDRQAQLRAALAALQELNVKQVELHEKYKSTPVYEAQTTQLINNQANAVVRTAASLGESLGTNATSAELTAIAPVLLSMGDFTTAEKLLNYALSAAETANDEAAALRWLGAVKFRGAQDGARRKEAESYFIRATKLDQKWQMSDQPYAVSWIHATTQFAWAQALAALDCSSAQQHFSEGVAILATAPPTIDFEQMRSTTRRQWTEGIGGVQTCTPDPQTPRVL